ncbi:MAG TPA: CPBP family intramembrane glutamic endopeptidase [Streptosporangiaceae bacterium]|nr:CPBP family intramembrane glutamic endopeptidase [Streptosporangiaceae bacterium]
MTGAGAGPPPTPETRMSGRRLVAGIVLAVFLAGLLAEGTTAVAHAVAPGWARTEGLTVLVVAEVYLAVIVALAIAAGGPAGVRDRLALHRPEARQIGYGLAVVVLAVAAGVAISLVFSPFSGGVVATLKAIVKAGSDESRMATATPLVWALIVVRLLALTGTAEELFFRGAVYGWLRRRLPVPLTIAVTTVLFALEHAYYPVLLPLVLGSGVALGWVRHRTHTVAVTIAMHVAVDLSLFLAAVAWS